MSDCISRQAAIDGADAIIARDTSGNNDVVKAMTAWKRYVEALPSAQPEIIHCESCEHWKNEHICECLSRYGTFETPKNFYCGYGKENR